MKRREKYKFVLNRQKLIGFFVVITNKDKEQNQKKSYWVGLGTSAVLSIITQLAALAAA